MATVTEWTVADHAEAAPYLITSDLFARMIEQEFFPPEDRVFLWGGRLYEKMAKSLPHASVQTALLNALVKRLPPGFYLGAENPVRLDALHLPLPDLVVVRGMPTEQFDKGYPEGRDVALVVEVAVTSLREDLTERLSRYALTLPDAVYLLADVNHRRLLVHAQPRKCAGVDRGEYGEQVLIGPGEWLRLRIGGTDLDPVAFEEVMR